MDNINSTNHNNSHKIKINTTNHSCSTLFTTNTDSKIYKEFQNQLKELENTFLEKLQQSVLALQEPNAKEVRITFDKNGQISKLDINQEHNIIETISTEFQEKLKQIKETVQSDIENSIVQNKSEFLEQISKDISQYRDSLSKIENNYKQDCENTIAQQTTIVNQEFAKLQQQVIILTAVNNLISSFDIKIKAVDDNNLLINTTITLQELQQKTQQLQDQINKRQEYEFLLQLVTSITLDQKKPQKIITNKSSNLKADITQEKHSKQPTVEDFYYTPTEKLDKIKFLESMLTATNTRYMSVINSLENSTNIGKLTKAVVDVEIKLTEDNFPTPNKLNIKPTQTEQKYIDKLNSDYNELMNCSDLDLVADNHSWQLLNELKQKIHTKVDEIVSKISNSKSLQSNIQQILTNISDQLNKIITEEAEEIINSAIEEKNKIIKSNETRIKNWQLLKTVLQEKLLPSLIEEQKELKIKFNELQENVKNTDLDNIMVIINEFSINPEIFIAQQKAVKNQLEQLKLEQQYNNPTNNTSNIKNVQEIELTKIAQVSSECDNMEYNPEINLPEITESEISESEPESEKTKDSPPKTKSWFSSWFKK